MRECYQRPADELNVVNCAAAVEAMRPTRRILQQDRKREGRRQATKPAYWWPFRARSFVIVIGLGLAQRSAEHGCD